jgi:repressor LexA
MMQGLSEELRRQMARAEISAQELAKRAKVSRAMIYNALSGANIPTAANLQKIASVLGSNVAELLVLSGQLSQQVELPTDVTNAMDAISIPVILEIRPGPPIIAIQEPGGHDTITISKKLAATGDFYALRIREDSMLQAGAIPGGIAIVRIQATVEDGAVAVMIVDAETVIRRVYHVKGEMELIPENPYNTRYKVKRYAPERITVIGEVLEFRAKTR